MELKSTKQSYISTKSLAQKVFQKEFKSQKDVSIGASTLQYDHYSIGFLYIQWGIHTGKFNSRPYMEEKIGESHNGDLRGRPELTIQSLLPMIRRV